MKIVRVDAWPVTLRLAVPYTIAYETVDRTTNVFVRLETDTLVGCGCAAPDEHVTRETAETVVRSILDLAAPLLAGQDPLRYALVLDRLKPCLARQPSARAAVDMALFDIVARHCGLPLWKFLGGYRESIMTSITIGIVPAAEALRFARMHVAAGFRSLKIKGGRDVEEDIAKIAELRQAVGPAIELRFDANQGYTVEQALDFIERTRPYGIELLEQPTPRDRPDLLGSVTRQASIPVMADESLVTLNDAFKLAQADRMDMINIKLMKVGGIAEAMHVNSVAMAAGLETMVSCVDEAGLAIAAGLAFALGRPNIAYADLDGHLDLIGDPTRDAVIIRQGQVYPRDAPGLGVQLP